MQINGAEQRRGHVLMIAGDSATRRRTVQVLPSENLAALSMVPVSALLESSLPSDTTYLDGLHDQNALLVRLRAAAATPGPLFVYLSGRLTTDRRGQQLYLALSRTTTSTARYTALPWEWLGIELRTRPQGLTTVVFDLAADKGAWPLLKEYGTLPASTAAEVFGVVTPPGFVGDEGVSTYTRHWIEQLRRSPERPTNARLHAFTVSAAALPPGALVLPRAPEIAAYEPVRQPTTNAPRGLAGNAPFLPHHRRADVSAEPDRPVRHPVPDHALAPDQQPPQPGPVFRPPAGPSGTPPPVPGPTDDDRRPAMPGHRPRTDQARQPARTRQRDIVVQQQTAPAPSLLPAPTALVAQDPRPHIHALAQAGRHTEAALLAQMWEQHALQTGGFDSPLATQWVEIRADLAKMSGNFMLATQLWIGAGQARLVRQSPDAPEVLSAAKSAHYCWTQLRDVAKARECGPDLVSLLRALPSLDRRHLTVAQQRLEFLHGAPDES
ncbi:hypothetical protein [Streptomyces atroolivaceus]|uniref:Uncharacterized protein n=1 Tax=Streptomyces atroolivaceus TaxID=66869 RepID=A0ABV9VGI1_STRAZ|nr:hypothetical protein [Streptomyces atroolivaceus]